MLNEVKKWCLENRIPLIVLLSASFLLGLIIAAVSFFSPPALAFLAGISFFGGAPFAFVTALPVSLAAFALGTLMTGISISILAASLFVTKQLLTIREHISLLCTDNEEEPNELPTDTYTYLAGHLKGEEADDQNDVDEEDEWDIEVPSSPPVSSFAVSQSRTALPVSAAPTYFGMISRPH